MQTLNKSNKMIKVTTAFLLLLSLQTVNAQDIAKQDRRSPISRPKPADITTPFQAVLTADSIGQAFILRIDNPTQLRLTVSITHPFYGSLFSKDTKEVYYANRFNMSQVEDGEYYLEIQYGKEKFKKQIVINTVTEVNRKLDLN